MTNMNGLDNDFTEIIARFILIKELSRRGDPMPNTNDWHDLYLNGYSGAGLTAMDSVRYNNFRCEVDGIVHMLMTHVQKRIDDYQPNPNRR